jgi:site-specific recombinase XerD
MSTRTTDNAILQQLKAHLKDERYTASAQRHYPSEVQRFLQYLQTKGLPVEAVSASDVDDFVRRRLRVFHKRNGRAPRDLRNWRWRYTSAIYKLGHLVRGEWPVEPARTSPVEVFHQRVVQEYDSWLRDLRGLAPPTRMKRVSFALQFLTALGSRGTRETLPGLSIQQIDVFLQQRCVNLARASIEDWTGCLRDFLRYLHGNGQIAANLSGNVIGPQIYEYEHTPLALTPEEVKDVLATVRRDLSPTGRRDYALLMLLATYGLRGSEIVALRLEDIDWKKELLRIRHSKTGAYSELPLLRAPGEAVLKYLEKARPRSIHRQIFLRVHAPYRPFAMASSLGGLISARLMAAGVTRPGNKGARAFRHARAVSLLRAAVPLKSIGDLLGHKSVRSTAVYLKLATDDLRQVGLDVPTGVIP